MDIDPITGQPLPSFPGITGPILQAQPEAPTTDPVLQLFANGLTLGEEVQIPPPTDEILYTSELFALLDDVRINQRQQEIFENILDPLISKKFITDIDAILDFLVEVKGRFNRYQRINNIVAENQRIDIPIIDAASLEFNDDVFTNQFNDRLTDINDAITDFKNGDIDFNTFNNKAETWNDFIANHQDVINDALPIYNEASQLYHEEAGNNNVLIQDINQTNLLFNPPLPPYPLQTITPTLDPVNWTLPTLPENLTSDAQAASLPNSVSLPSGGFGAVGANYNPLTLPIILDEGESSGDPNTLSVTFVQNNEQAFFQSYLNNLDEQLRFLSRLERDQDDVEELKEVLGVENFYPVEINELATGAQTGDNVGFSASSETDTSPVFESILSQAQLDQLFNEFGVPSGSFLIDSIQLLIREEFTEAGVLSADLGRIILGTKPLGEALDPTTVGVVASIGFLDKIAILQNALEGADFRERLISLIQAELGNTVDAAQLADSLVDFLRFNLVAVGVFILAQQLGLPSLPIQYILATLPTVAPADLDFISAFDIFHLVPTEPGDAARLLVLQNIMQLILADIQGLSAEQSSHIISEVLDKINAQIREQDVANRRAALHQELIDQGLSAGEIDRQLRTYDAQQREIVQDIIDSIITDSLIQAGIPQDQAIAAAIRANAILSSQQQSNQLRADILRTDTVRDQVYRSLLQDDFAEKAAIDYATRIDINSIRVHEDVLQQAIQDANAQNDIERQAQIRAEIIREQVQRDLISAGLDSDRAAQVAQDAANRLAAEDPSLRPLLIPALGPTPLEELRSRVRYEIELRFEGITGKDQASRAADFVDYFLFEPSNPNAAINVNRTILTERIDEVKTTQETRVEEDYDSHIAYYIKPNRLNNRYMDPANLLIMSEATGIMYARPPQTVFNTPQGSNPNNDITSTPM